MCLSDFRMIGSKVVLLLVFHICDFLEQNSQRLFNLEKSDFT